MSLLFDKLAELVTRFISELHDRRLDNYQFIIITWSYLMILWCS